MAPRPDLQQQIFLGVATLGILSFIYVQYNRTPLKAEDRSNESKPKDVNDPHNCKQPTLENMENSITTHIIPQSETTANDENGSEIYDKFARAEDVEDNEKINDENDDDVETPALSSEELYIATENGDIAQIRKCLKNGVNVNGCLGDGETPLLIASKKGLINIVPILLKAGADVNSARSDGATPFIMAIQEGNEEIVQMLLAAGAEVKNSFDQEFDQNKEPQEEGGEEASKVEGEEEKPHPLLIAAANGHAKIVEILIDYGLNVNDSDFNGATALWMASQDNHIDVVKVLIRNKCYIDAIMNGGETPLIIACHKGHVEIAQILLEHGANVNQVADDGMGALFAASHQGHLPIVKLLLSYHANISLQYVGFTPLSIAQVEGHVEIVELLQLSNVC